MEITINKRNYHLEGDHYNGDIVLIAGSKTVTIDGGYEALKADAIKEVGRYEEGYDGQELEYSSDEVRQYVDQHIEDFIRNCFEEGKTKSC